MRTSERLGRDALTNDVAYNAYVALIEAVDEQRNRNGDEQINSIEIIILESRSC